MRALSLGLTLLAGCTIASDFGGYSGADGGGSDASVDLAVDAGADMRMPGACEPACDAGRTCCDGSCVDLSTDGANCGGCGAVCPDVANAESACVEGECTFRCDEGLTDCEGECLDTAANPDHCGACGNTCPDAPFADRTCVGGTCDIACFDGFADCDPGAEGCESFLGSPTSCGGCDEACGAGEVCADLETGRQCTATCPPGTTGCDGACVDTQTSLAHCGGCGRACPTRPNTTVECAAGTCTYACTGAFRNCDDEFANGCEVEPAFYARDRDGDLFTVGLAARFCPDDVPDGFSERTEKPDCNDENPAINPDATEECDGIDNDCTGGADDPFRFMGAPVGGTCRCGVGAAPGEVVCADDGSEAICDYPAEVCTNGADDDCDGARDDADSDCDRCLSDWASWSCTVSSLGTGGRTCIARCGAYVLQMSVSSLGAPSGSCTTPSGTRLACRPRMMATCADCEAAFDAGCCEP
ncbi:MAG: MopE-related protein [Myxococcota bacterium]